MSLQHVWPTVPEEDLPPRSQAWTPPRKRGICRWQRQPLPRVHELSPRLGPLHALPNSNLDSVKIGHIKPST